MQWDDGVTTLARDDGTATEDITRTAQYTWAPDFKRRYSWLIEAYATSDPYFTPGGMYVRDFNVRVSGTVSWVAVVGLFTYTAQSPAEHDFDEVVWSGQALGDMSADDVVAELTGVPSGQTSSPGPLYLPNYASGSTQSVTFVLAGSANAYTVSGTGATDPYPGGQVPGGQSSGTGEVAVREYTATSWSAEYA